MRETSQNIIRAYIVGGVWFIVMLTTVAVLLAPLDALYAAVDADPAVRTATTMTIAIVAAPVGAMLAWNLIRRRVEPSTAASAAPDDGAEAALAAIR